MMASVEFLLCSLVFVVGVHSAEVCDETLTSLKGSLQSPDIPDNSTNKVSCVYVITAPDNYRVTLTFTVLDLPSDPDCSFNYVEIRDGESDSSPRLGRFCNTSLPRPLRTFGNQMWIKFDGNSNRTNFSATYASAVHPDSFLLITGSDSAVTGAIFRVDTETNSSIPVPMSSDLYNPIAVDYDAVEQTIYWTEVGVVNRVRSASLDGSDVQTVRDIGADSVLDGLAVDPVSRLIFYTDAGKKQIVMMTMSTFVTKTVIDSGLDMPRAIVLDPVNGVVFWTDWGRYPRIERASYDGSDRKALVSNFLRDINALAVDVKNNRLFWADSSTNLVETSDLEGNGRTVLLKVDDSHHFFSLTFLGNFLYITDWGPEQAQSKTSTVFRLTVAERKYSVFGVVSARLNDIHGYREDQSEKASNGCGNNNGGCDVICIPLPGNSSKCMCPDGQSLTSSQKTCVNGTQETVNIPLIAGAVVGSVVIVAVVVVLIVVVVVVIKRKRDALRDETPVEKSCSQEHPYSSLRDVWRKSIFNKNRPYIAENIDEDAEQPEADYTEVPDVDIRPPQPVPVSNDNSHSQPPDLDVYLHPVHDTCDLNLSEQQSDFDDYLHPTLPVGNNTLHTQQPDDGDYLQPTQPACENKLCAQQSDSDDYLNPVPPADYPDCDGNTVL